MWSAPVDCLDPDTFNLRITRRNYPHLRTCDVADVMATNETTRDRCGFANAATRAAGEKTLRNVRGRRHRSSWNALIR
jgi:hypothetical protein